MSGADAAGGPLSLLAVALEPALGAAAREDGRVVRSVSLTLDLAAPSAPGECTAVEARVDRSTRTLVFVSGEARGVGGRLLAVAQAVYRVIEARGA